MKYIFNTVLIVKLLVFILFVNMNTIFSSDKITPIDSIDMGIIKLDGLSLEPDKLEDGESQEDDSTMVDYSGNLSASAGPFDQNRHLWYRVDSTNHYQWLETQYEEDGVFKGDTYFLIQSENNEPKLSIHYEDYIRGDDGEKFAEYTYPMEFIVDDDPENQKYTGTVQNRGGGVVSIHKNGDLFVDLVLIPTGAEGQYYFKEVILSDLPEWLQGDWKSEDSDSTLWKITKNDILFLFQSDEESDEGEVIISDYYFSVQGCNIINEITKTDSEYEVLLEDCFWGVESSVKLSFTKSEDNTIIASLEEEGEISDENLFNYDEIKETKTLNKVPN